MLGRNHHIGCAEQRIAAGGIYRQLIACGGAEIHFGAVAAADPVFLLGLNALQIVHLVQIVDQSVGIGSNLEHPLALYTVHNGAVAAFAGAVDHFLVGQHALAAGAPVDIHFLFIGKAMLVHLQEDPLGPLVIAGVGGIDLTIPVDGEAQSFQLAFKVRHIVFGNDSRMNVVLHGKVFGGQAECIPAHGIQSIVALQTLFAADHIHGCIAAGMAHMQALARGIRKLNEAVELRLGMVHLHREGFFVFPDFLPLGLNGLEIIFQNNQLPIYI